MSVAPGKQEDKSDKVLLYGTFYIKSWEEVTEDARNAFSEHFRSKRYDEKMLKENGLCPWMLEPSGIIHPIKETMEWLEGCTMEKCGEWLDALVEPLFGKPWKNNVVEGTMKLCQLSEGNEDLFNVGMGEIGFDNTNHPILYREYESNPHEWDDELYPAEKRLKAELGYEGLTKWLFFVRATEATRKAEQKRKERLRKEGQRNKREAPTKATNDKKIAKKKTNNTTTKTHVNFF